MFVISYFLYAHSCLWQPSTFSHRYEVHSCTQWEGKQCTWASVSFSTLSLSFSALSDYPNVLPLSPRSQLAHSASFILFIHHQSFLKRSEERDFGIFFAAVERAWLPLEWDPKCGCGELWHGPWHTSPHCLESLGRPGPTEWQVGLSRTWDSSGYSSDQCAVWQCCVGWALLLFCSTTFADSHSWELLVTATVLVTDLVQQEGVLVPCSRVMKVSKWA